MQNQFKRQKVQFGQIPANVMAKWSPTTLEEGFVPFPKTLLRVMKDIFVGDDAIKELSVVLSIVDFKRDNLKRLPSRAFLAFIAGLEEEEFSKILKGLEQKGYARSSGTEEEMDISLDGLLSKTQEKMSDG
jgi:hypothetical protein